MCGQTSAAPPPSIVLNKGKCDLVPGALAKMPGVATTRAYMRLGLAF